jgi:1,4-dihydroxy-2-naphthoate octaprenyltransferase
LKLKEFTKRNRSAAVTSHVTNTPQSADGPAGPPTGLTWVVATARLPFLTATLVPVILGTLVAWRQGWSFDWLNFVLALLGGSLLHIGTNISNDYFDHLSGTDEINEERITPFTGGSRMIQMRVNSPLATRNYALLAFAGAALTGAVLFFRVGWPVLAFGLVGMFSGWFYTAPPLRLVATGIGEFMIGLNFGVLMVLGSYFVQTGTLNPAEANILEPILASLPVALFITNVLYINQFPDARADAATGKRHWVVRLGKERAVWVYTALTVLAYAIVVAAAALRLMALSTLVMLLSLPMGIKAIRILRANYDNSPALAPACGMTIQLHLVSGLLLALAYVAAHFIPALR